MEKKTLNASQKMKKTSIGEIPVDWKVLKIEEVVIEIADGGTPSRKIPEYFNGDIYWATVDDIEFKIKSTKQTITKAGLKNSSAKLWPPETVILTTGASIGKVGIANFPLATKQGITGLLCDKSVVIPEYLARFLESKEKFLNTIAQGSTFKEVRAPILRKILLPLPPLPEQRKIAEILSSVDAVIDQTQKVIDQTEILKKGLMQELLTRGIPGRHKKFKKTEIGVIPSDWEVVKLGKYSKILSGGTPSTQNRKYWEGQIPWITSADILGMHEIYPKKFINIEAIKNSATNLIPRNSIVVVTRVGLGKIAINRFDMCISQDSQGIIPDKAIFHLEYLAYYLSIAVQGFTVRNQGTAIKGVLKKDLVSLNIPLPTIGEQKEIATTLINADKNIGFNILLQREISNLKSALMQVLLTGKLRVKI